MNARGFSARAGHSGKPELAAQELTIRVPVRRVPPLVNLMVSSRLRRRSRPGCSFDMAPRRCGRQAFANAKGGLHSGRNS